MTMSSLPAFASAPPCPQIHEIMAGWATYVLQGLSQAVRQLQARAANEPEMAIKANRQISLVPPSLAQFFFLQGQLQAMISQKEQSTVT